MSSNVRECFQLKWVWPQIMSMLKLAWLLIQWVLFLIKVILKWTIVNGIPTVFCFLVDLFLTFTRKEEKDIDRPNSPLTTELQKKYSEGLKPVLRNLAMIQNMTTHSSGVVENLSIKVKYRPCSIQDSVISQDIAQWLHQISYYLVELSIVLDEVVSCISDLVSDPSPDFNKTLQVIEQINFLAEKIDGIHEQHSTEITQVCSHSQMSKSMAQDIMPHTISEDVFISFYVPSKIIGTDIVYSDAKREYHIVQTLLKDAYYEFNASRFTREYTATALWLIHFFINVGLYALMYREYDPTSMYPTN